MALIEALVRVGRWRQAKALLNEIMSEMWKTEALKRICTVILDAKSLNQTKIDNKGRFCPSLVLEPNTRKQGLGWCLG